MTYSAMELSAYGGRPVETFEFNRESVQFWRYTSADRDVTVSGNIYAAVPIKRSRIESGSDVERNAVELECASTVSFVQEFIAYPPTDRISVVIRRYHDGDGQIASIWVGRVVNVSFRGEKVKIRCESSVASLKRPTLRRLYQITCPHVLYGAACGLDRMTWRISAVLTAVSGMTLTAAAFATGDDRLKGGYVEISLSGYYNKRFITDHNGTTITTNMALPGASVGLAVGVYPGCTHSLAICNNRFANRANYGGYPFIPDKNPMTGSQIF